MFGDSFITIKDKKTKKNNNKMDLIRLWIEFRRRKKKKSFDVGKTRK
jgi:hypothetical protein